MNVSIVPALKVLKPAAMIAVVTVLGLVVGYWANAALFPGTSPEQPIAFSHKIHAGDNEIECLYCHTQARRSISAGVPSVRKCIGCHNEVATERPQIRKLMNYWDNKEPIPWIKVHDLPDFVHFTHKRHVLAGIECQTCHGPVETMDVISRGSGIGKTSGIVLAGAAAIKMGDCLNCHKEHEVENGLDCWTCHK